MIILIMSVSYDYFYFHINFKNIPIKCKQGTTISTREIVAPSPFIHLRHVR
jgi:hypothetical protein